MHDQIRRLEADIEQLAEGFERCRKAMLVSKVAIGAGGILILAYFLGAVSFDPTLLIGALAGIIGGVVIYGSNSTTSKQMAAALKAAEIRRAELIEMLNLRTVGARPGGLQGVKS